jgi:N-acetyl-alpha-D-muramate 1-phosphate uridylyltransferase
MPDQPLALMLFAAGLGLRMGELTRTRPKPLIEVAGRPMIDHALELAGQAGVCRTVVNTHYLADQLAAHLGGRPGLSISHEPELLETGGGLRAALPLLGAGPVFTLNSDSVWTGPNPLTALRRAWGKAMGALLLLVPHEHARGYRGFGDFRLASDGRLMRGGPLVYTGAQILRTESLDAIAPTAFSLNLVWDALAAQGGLYGVVHDGGWCDVGHPAGIVEAEAMLSGQE